MIDFDSMDIDITPTQKRNTTITAKRSSMGSKQTQIILEPQKNAKRRKRRE
jgi:hypothetical protein